MTKVMLDILCNTNVELWGSVLIQHFGMKPTKTVVIINRQRFIEIMRTVLADIYWVDALLLNNTYH